MADETHLSNTLSFTTTAPNIELGDLVVREISGVESMSTPYEFRIELACAIDGGLPPDFVEAMLASSAQIGFGPGGLHRVSGVLREIELLEMEHDGSATIYQAILVPRFWLATLTHRSRCFNDQSIPDIIATVLAEHGLGDGTDFELVLDATYVKREYVVQYEESDFAFLSRWMERLGIFYYFEQSDEVEKIVFVDANAALLAAPDNGEVTYASRDQEGVVGGIHHMRRKNRRVPKKVFVRDYNWRNPTKLLSVGADIDAENGTGLQVINGDHFGDDGEGTSYATLRAETWLATKRTFSAWTVNVDFAPGYRFTVSGAPVGELDTEYVITRVTHESRQHNESSGSGSYRNDIEAIPYAVPYRPARETPWPRIDGVVTAKIDAASVNSAAPVDDKGRYKVVFSYDPYGGFGGRASRWVRKAEPYSGQEYGMHFTLHVGAEVAVAHVGGDPDRPIIVGSVPNATTTSPLTSSHATRSSIRTRSGIIFDFEDDA